MSQSIPSRSPTPDERTVSLIRKRLVRRKVTSCAVSSARLTAAKVGRRTPGATIRGLSLISLRRDRVVHRTAIAEATLSIGHPRRRHRVTSSALHSQLAHRHDGRLQPAARSQRAHRVRAALVNSSAAF